MTAKDCSAIQRLLGVIEGVACSLDGRTNVVIGDSVAAIDEIIEKYIAADICVGNKDGKDDTK